MRSKALFLLVPAPSSELGLLSPSMRKMGNSSFAGDKDSEFTVSAISPEVSFGFWKEGIGWWIVRSMVVSTIPLVLL